MDDEKKNFYNEPIIEKNRKQLNDPMSKRNSDIYHEIELVLAAADFEL